jgi:hypothetical protein
VPSKMTARASAVALSLRCAKEKHRLAKEIVPVFHGKNAPKLKTMPPF